MPAPGLVVVGASLAGLRAVEAARTTGYDGSVILGGAEEHLPYDRPPLSKAFLDADSATTATTYRGEQELQDLGVELRLGTPASALDPIARQVSVGGDTLPYQSLVIATGAQARGLPGEWLAGVHTLRTLDDARHIRHALDAGARTVIVGAGFIGAEVAAAARKRALPVTVVEAAELPLIRAVGQQMAGACLALHARHGTELRCGVEVSAVEGDGRVQWVVLSDGTVLPADLVVVGVGATPATGWLEGSGLTLDDGVVCDQRLRAHDGVYAAGDVARWHNPLFGTSMRLEHWTSAAEQGATAARNALTPDAATPYRTVPYFWSDWGPDKLQMVGISDADEITVIGSVDDERWLALYRRGDQLIGALTLNLPGKIMKYRALIDRGACWSDALTFSRT
jgi:NADPH-dependent 2,4-dienoyl-CoA reductase/sulfur reductase-like enzyme